MEIFRDSSGTVFDWVVSSLDNGEVYRDDLTLGIKCGNILIGGVIYTQVKDDVYLSIYTDNPKWCTRKNLSIFFDIPFNILKAKKAICAVSEDNKAINKLLKGLGLIQEKTKNARSDGSRLILYSIDKEQLYKRKWFKL